MAARVFRRPMLKYAHSPKTLKYSAVAGQTTFITAIFCGWRISSAAMMSAHTKAIAIETAGCNHRNISSMLGLIRWPAGTGA